MKYILVIIIAVIVFFSACSDKTQDDGKTVFRYNESSGISSLDPAFARNLANMWATNQIFNGLVQMDSAMNTRPCIASSWTISPDGKEYRFKLRDDVYFHYDITYSGEKGRRVTATDFEYSFRRIVDKATASPGAWVFENVDVANGRYAFEAPDDTTLIIRLRKAFPPFLGILTMQYCAVILPEAVEAAGDEFRARPIGTGPFRLKLWKEGVKLVLTKNPYYFEKVNGESLPHLDAVAITFIIDKQSAFLEFIKGKLDFLSGIDASYKDELLTSGGNLNPKYIDQFNLVSQPYLNTEYLGFLMDTEGVDQPLNKKEVRQAINYGFDRERMMKYLRNNIGTPGIYGFVPLGLIRGRMLDGYAYNPEKARHLLKSAGYPGGKGLDEITLSTTPEYVDLCMYIQHELSVIGIDLSIDVIPAATMKEMKSNAKLPFFRGSWIADYPDAENYLSLFLSKNFSPSGPNYTHFSNEEFNALYNLAMKEVDDKERNDLYWKMDSLIMDEAPVVVLYYDRVLRFSGKNIKGLGSNPVNMLDLKYVRKVN